ncbi:dihydrodipicolinate synthase family protein [Ramlibacter henchirensis]|uniref:Dihydrodipicolinate synthase family protein n=1 Tax=Ramlibacter henchirensis TaxID=204072 RepID=A0A4Z0BWS7_9BURK|nr:dihydrodipicolinate synthase family protein [Ramlibacter henchirensis]TFZ02810.1 dihydrodipicolinate synthase family protein [Ramlibacter henchirensis]
MPKYAKGDARAWIRSSFRGYFVALYTPYGADGAIDEAALRHNTELTLSLPGVGGLSVHSIHQEFWTLTDAERMRVTEVVLQTVAGRKPVIVGVSDTSARNVVEFANHASAHGADAVMVWPPYYGPKTASGVRDFHEYVAARTHIGLFVYSTTLSELGFYLTPDMVETLLDIPNVCGVQSTVASPSGYAAMMERVGDRICVSTSLEETFLFGKLGFGERAPDFLMGASRPLLVQNHSHPRCGDFLAAALAGDYVEAARHMRDIMRIADKLQSRYFAQGFHHVALFKQLSTHLGLRGGPARAPMGEPTPAELAECFEIMAAAGLTPPAGER